MDDKKYAEMFSKIYRDNCWGSGGDSEFYSGYGSHEYSCVSKSIGFLNGFITDRNIKSVLDFGCGDFNIGSQIDVDMYYGTDVVKELIDYNQEKYGDERHQFILNDESYNFPSVDLIIFKEVLQHLDNEKIKEILDNIIGKMSFKYILVLDSSLTDDVNENINVDSNDESVLMSSREILNYNLHLDKEPFNYDFTLYTRLPKRIGEYWNIWLYRKKNNIDEN